LILEVDRSEVAMRVSSKSGFVLMLVASLLALSVMSAAGATEITVQVAGGEVAAIPTPTCNTVPLAVVAPYFGGHMPTVQKMQAGQTLGTGWIGCTYEVGGAYGNLGIEYRTGQTASQFASLFATVNSSYGGIEVSGIGNGAIEVNGAGHDVGTVPGVAPNVPLYVLYGTVVFYLRAEPMLPIAKEIALAKAMIPLIASGKTSTPFSGATFSPTPTTAPTVSPQIAIGVAQFNGANGRMSLRLSCTKARCSGVAELIRKAGAVVLAKTSYVMVQSSKKTFNLTLTAKGRSILSNASTAAVRAILRVTVKGGKTVTKAIAVT
jgi:hypothetical protein